MIQEDKVCQKIDRETVHVEKDTNKAVCAFTENRKIYSDRKQALGDE